MSDAKQQDKTRERGEQPQGAEKPQAAPQGQERAPQAQAGQKPQQGAQEGAQRADAGNEQVQAQADEAQQQGFRGVEVDPTPNENYTVQGVTSGAPTPETDPEQARKVGSRRFEGAAENEQGNG